MQRHPYGPLLLHWCSDVQQIGSHLLSQGQFQRKRACALSGQFCIPLLKTRRERQLFIIAYSYIKSHTNLPLLEYNPLWGQHI